MSNLVQNGIVKLEGLNNIYLPQNFKVKYSLDCSNSNLEKLPEGLEVVGDLIIKNSLIKVIPKNAIIHKDIYCDNINLIIEEGAVIGGKIITPITEYYPAVPEDNLIITETKDRIVYLKKHILNTPSNYPDADYWYPTLTFYDNIYSGQINAVSYVNKDGEEYYLSCSTFSNSFFVVNYHMAKARGIDKYKDYDIINSVITKRRTTI